MGLSKKLIRTQICWLHPLCPLCPEPCEAANPAGESREEIQAEGAGSERLLENSKSLKMSAGINFEETASFIEENLMKPLSVKQEKIIKAKTLDTKEENVKEPENSGLSHGTAQNIDPHTDMLGNADITNSVTCGSELPQTHTGHIRTKTFLHPESDRCLSMSASLGTQKRVCTGERKFVCSKCGKCFRSKSHLTKHEKIHTGVKQFACSECEKCFRSNRELTEHKKMHTGEKPFACSECEKCFRSKSYLMVHERIHTGEKPFPCSECEKCFRTKGELTAHERIHTGEKPFACFECGKCFRTTSELTEHKKMHTGEK
uniref:C2H2-type domain-containing protein n=1 Tax=Leptobrachium leishanense TaxID=445787 RepID=A0A8C5ME81_9ANUR